MEVSFLVLATGVLCGFWDTLFGVRLYQAGKGTFRDRAAFAWSERRLTIIGSGLVLLATILAGFGV